MSKEKNDSFEENKELPEEKKVVDERNNVKVVRKQDKVELLSIMRGSSNYRFFTPPSPLVEICSGNLFPGL